MGSAASTDVQVFLCCTHLAPRYRPRLSHTTVVALVFRGVCLPLYFETRSYFVAQASLKLAAVLLLQPPKFWDYSVSPPNTA